MKLRGLGNIFNLATLLLIIIPLYFLQNELHISGAPLLACWLLIDFYYLYKEFSTKGIDKFEVIIIFFWALNFIYWFSSPQTRQSFRTIEQFKDLTVALLTYFPFKYWSRTEAIKTSYMFCFLLMELAFSIVYFYGYAARVSDESGVEEVTNNISYKFVAILPLLGLLFKRKYFLYPALLVCIYFVIIGAKRGAIVSMILMLMAFVFYYYKYSAIKKRSRALLVGLLAIGVVSFFVYYSYIGSEYLQFRIDRMIDGNDESGDERLYFYSAIWKNWLNSDTLHKMFGNGFNYSIVIAGNYAHNDWLELMAGMGVFGMICYAVYLGELLNIIRKSFKYLPYDYQYLMVSSFIMIFSRSFYSMSYVSMDTAVAMAVIAFAQSQAEKNKNLFLK